MSSPTETLSEPLLSSTSKENDVENHHNGLTTTTTTTEETVVVATDVLEPLLIATDDGGNNNNNDQDEERQHTSSLLASSGTLPIESGQIQPNAFRDWPWAVLFGIQFIIVLVLAIMGSIHSAQDYHHNDSDGKSSSYDDDDILTDDGTSNGGNNGGSSSSVVRPYLDGIWFFVILTTSVIALSAIVMNVLLGPLSSMMIQISLVISPICFGITALASLLTLNIPMLIFSSAMTIIGIMYAQSVWHRIPFATANICVAMAALRDNHGLWIIAYLITIKAYVWTAIWTLSVVEIFLYHPQWVYNCSTIHGTDDDNDMVCRWSTRGQFIAVGLFLSLFWTAQVLKNVFHTTIAGVVGTWWFTPDEARSSSSALANSTTAVDVEGGGEVEANNNNDNNNNNDDSIAHANMSTRSSFCCSCCGCSPAIFDSWIRSTFYSFGSICLGSLLVGILRVLQLLVKCGRQRRDVRRNLNGSSTSTASGDLCCCMLQCLVDHLENLMEYFNQWSFVYVGLYGYKYIEAGKKVGSLFAARGWSVIVNDYLVSRSLGMMTTLIGLITGAMGVVIGFFFFGPLAALHTFVIGAILGMTSSNILFGVVVSAINTIVVSFAEAPDSLRLNHPPELYVELVEAWRLAYPEQFRI